jgi:hypothetical protein
VNAWHSRGSRLERFSSLLCNGDRMAVRLSIGLFAFLQGLVDDNADNLFAIGG